MPRPFARSDRDEPAGLLTGYLLVLASAVVLSLLSFARLDHGLVVLALGIATLGVVAGLVLNVAVRRAHLRRNARHRAWADTVGVTSLSEFRADLDRRDEAVAHLDRSWGVPLLASFALVVSALWVPWELISPLAPSPDVDVLTTWWLVVSLGGAGVCAVLSVVAGVRSESSAAYEHEDA